MSKRPLGLGSKNREKKQKLNNDDDSSSSNKLPASVNQIQVELDDNCDPDNEIVQLRGLWESYSKSNKDDELILNGIVHECDRLLRESQQNQSILPDEFHAIYSLALSELTIFKAGEQVMSEDRREEKKLESKKNKVISEFFATALERCELGLNQYTESQLLKLVKAKVLLQQIPLQYISHLKVSDTNGEQLGLYNKLQIAKENISILPDHKDLVFEVLEMFDDLLDIVKNFGREDEIDEGLDSDDDELPEVNLSTEHPLYKIRESIDDNYVFFREKLVELFETMKKPELDTEEESENQEFKLYKAVARRLGQSFLQLSEEPSYVFTELTYNGNESSEINKLSAKDAQKTALDLVSKAIKYFEEAKEKYDPQTWVDIAEATIDLGNLYDYESKEQESAYIKAEKILEKANKASHGKYKDILDNLMSKD